MGFLSRLRDRISHKPRFKIPDDSEITKALGVAKRANKTASAKLNASVKRQEQDALFVRQVISDVLQRTEEGKGNAGNR